LQSIKDTTLDKSSIEVLIAVDDDDNDSIQAVEYYKTMEFKDLNIQYFVRPYCEGYVFINRDYYNWLASKAQGNYIWINGDDLVIQVQEWDRIILNELNNYLLDKKDRIVCAGISDNTPKPSPILPQFPCFPLVSKEARDLMQFVLHPNIPTWGADYALYKLYTQANRYLEIKDRVYLNHVSFHTKQVPEDATAKRIGKSFNMQKGKPENSVQVTVDVTVPKQVQVIKDYIAKF
jgi:hypothetical protein